MHLHFARLPMCAYTYVGSQKNYFCTLASYVRFFHMQVGTTCIRAPYFHIGTTVPTNVNATVLTPRSIKITWNPSSLFGITGYIISYTTNASYTSGESVRGNGGGTTSYILINLEENTHYIITVQATSNSSISPASNKVSVITSSDSK